MVSITLKALLPLLSMSSERLHFLPLVGSAIFHLTCSISTRGSMAFKVRPRPNRKYLLGRCYETGNRMTPLCSESIVEAAYQIRISKAGVYAHAPELELEFFGIHHTQPFCPLPPPHPFFNFWIHALLHSHFVNACYFSPQD